MFLATASSFQTRNSRRFGAHTLGHLRLRETRLRTRLKKGVKIAQIPLLRPHRRRGIRGLPAIP